MSTNESDIFVAKMRDPLFGTTRHFVTAEALAGAWVQGDHGMTEPTYTREDMARAWDEGFMYALASMTVYRTNDRSGLIPNPYEREEA